MFILDGKRLPLDKAFTTSDGVQYPANWLRLSTLQEKEAIGIQEVPDEVTPSYDQGFYWGPNNPKDHAQLVELWTTKTKEIAGTLLNPYDWYVVRNAETGIEIPQEVLDYRASVRTQSNNREVLIKGTQNTDELCAIIRQDFDGLLPWPKGPFETVIQDQVDSVTADDTIQFDGTTQSGVFTASTLFSSSAEDTITFDSGATNSGASDVTFFTTDQASQDTITLGQFLIYTDSRV